MHIEKFYPVFLNKKKNEETKYAISHIVIKNYYMKIMYQIAPKQFFRVLGKADCLIK